MGTNGDHRLINRVGRLSWVMFPVKLHIEPAGSDDEQSQLQMSVSVASVDVQTMKNSRVSS